MRTSPILATTLLLTLLSGLLVTVPAAADGSAARLTSTGLPDCYDPDGVTPVSCVQGDGEATPLAGEDVTVQAVVTSLFQDLFRGELVLDGFFMQEEAADADTDPATSEGLFVFCRASCPQDLAVGDLVTVTGEATEFFGKTQIDAAFGSGTIQVGPSVSLPPATEVDLPAPGRTDDPATFEALEGMVVTFPDTLVVSEYFQLDRFGQLVLTVDERPTQYTQTNPPDEAGYQAHLDDLATRRIPLDDATNDQNVFIQADEDLPYPYPTPGFSVDNVVRGGDTVTGLRGVMDWSFPGSGANTWRIRPIHGEDYTFERANPRTDAPADVGGALTVAAFNVLNYFTTIDDGSNACGPDGTLDCRGANSAEELARQTDKIVAALLAMDADVVGLIEIQNDDGASTEALVDALNAVAGDGTYAAIDTGTIGTDAIKQAMIYQPAAVTPVGEPFILDATVDPRFDDDRNRPVLIQTFADDAGEEVTVAVNHLKSKGSPCGEGDDAPETGAGNCDGTRTAAAAALVEVLATNPTGSVDERYLVIGDLNAYAMEAPITTLTDAGYTDLLGRQGDYTYLFDGQVGTLDYALASPGLTDEVTGVTAWHINADEVPVLDYNDTVLDSGERFFERRSAALPLYESTAYRSSDHDPVIVGLELTNDIPVADAGGPYRVKAGDWVTLDATGSTDPDGTSLTYEWDLDGDGMFDDAEGPTPTLQASRPPGHYTVAVRITDADGATAEATATLTVTTGAGTVPPGRR